MKNDTLIYTLETADIFFVLRLLLFSFVPRFAILFLELTASLCSRPRRLPYSSLRYLASSHTIINLQKFIHKNPSYAAHPLRHREEKRKRKSRCEIPFKILNARKKTSSLLLSALCKILSSGKTTLLTQLSRCPAVCLSFLRAEIQIVLLYQRLIVSANIRFKIPELH